MTRVALPALVAALGLGLHAGWRARLEQRQQAEGLTIAAEGGGLAADVAVPTLALGAFRGVVVDWLWLRSISLREQGRHYEARQLAEQICRLQPRLPDVWAYLGHDLAYNMAGAVDGKEERWRWIQNGIELLRDQGLRYNPDDPDIHFTLARIYQDKIGTTTDDHHQHFKNAHAVLMWRLLGDAGLEALAASPPSLAALAAADPEAAALLERLRRAGVGEEELDPREPPPEGAAAQAALAAARADRAWPRVELAARAEALRRVGLDPALMAEVDRTWGPLDWRGCDAAAIYWAWRGVKAAGRLPGRVRDEYALRRTILAALKNAVRRGRVELVPDGLQLHVIPSPRPELVGRLEDAVRDAIADADRVMASLPPEERRSPAQAELYDAAFLFARNQRYSREDSLAEFVVLLAEHGLEVEARRLFARGARDYPDQPALQLPYEEFVRRVMLQRFVDAGTYETQAGMTQLLEGTWRSAYRALAWGQLDRYRGLSSMARAQAARWDAYLRSLDEPDARRRLGVDHEAVRERALGLAAAETPPVLRQRLADRLGRPVESLAPPGGDR